MCWAPAAAQMLPNERGHGNALGLGACRFREQASMAARDALCGRYVAQGLFCPPPPAPGNQQGAFNRSSRRPAELTPSDTTDHHRTNFSAEHILLTHCSYVFSVSISMEHARGATADQRNRLLTPQVPEARETPDSDPVLSTICATDPLRS